MNIGVRGFLKWHLHQNSLIKIYLEDLDDSLQKRKTSSENVSGSGGKKLKRRNESFYSVSATENEDS